MITVKLVMGALECGAFIHEVIHKLPFIKNLVAWKLSYLFANNINLSSAD